MCGTFVFAIWDHKNSTELAEEVREDQICTIRPEFGFGAVLRSPYGSMTPEMVRPTAPDYDVVSDLMFNAVAICVSKILTPRNVLKKCLLKAEINCWNNSFHIIYHML